MMARHSKNSYTYTFQCLKENPYRKCLKCLFGGLIVKGNDFVGTFLQIMVIFGCFSHVLQQELSPF